jgi:hypothetical protein
MLIFLDISINSSRQSYHTRPLDGSVFSFNIKCSGYIFSRHGSAPLNPHESSLPVCVLVQQLLCTLLLMGHPCNLQRTILGHFTSSWWRCTESRQCWELAFLVVNSQWLPGVVRKFSSLVSRQGRFSDVICIAEFCAGSSAGWDVP